jgi:methyl-accepting chemotaxis protein
VAGASLREALFVIQIIRRRRLEGRQPEHSMRISMPKGTLFRISGMSISSRLHLGFAIVLVLLAALGVLSYFQNEAQSAASQRLVTEDARRASLANDMQIAVQEMVIYLGDMTKQEDPAEITRLQKDFKESSDRYRKIRQDLVAVPSHGSPAEEEWKKTLKAMIDTEAGAHQLFEQMAALAGKTEPAALRDFYEMQVYTPLTAWMESLTTLRNAMATSMARSAEASKQSAQVAQGVTLAMVGLALGVGLLSAVLISRSITRPLQRAVSLAETVAKGDLSVDLSSDQRDEVGVLLNALGNMQTSLRSLVGDIRQCADSIHTASTEVAMGNTDLSQRTELTASNLQQTASSLEELTGTVRQSADSAATANQLASSARGAANRGGQVVQQVVSNMSEISAASRKIADIIGVIDGIAFQTNLLALNAAVEAARAGEQGRGFAVVAGEVRNLAQRAATAAREIKALIGDSVDRVDSGTRLVQEAGGTMQEIVAAVQRVTDVIGEITAATAEQSSGIGEVNGAVVRLDQMTQQNAALVEQSAAAAESLRDQADRLNGLVGTFQLRRGEGAAAPAAPAAVAPKPEPAPKVIAKAAPKAAAAAKPATPPKSGATPKPVPATTADDDWTSF